ncbi:hypothetical protein JW977_00965 [Candidatus Falkowbacteria bacterium]|nr:hypothetical protein [Candidatus Falkowbacteria bacterium]
MEIIKIIFKNDDPETAFIKSEIDQIAHSLSDLNCFPIFLPQYIGSEMTAFNEITVKSTKLIDIFKKQIELIGLEKVVTEISNLGTQEGKIIIFMSKKDNQIDMDKLAMAILTSEVDNFFPKVDDFILLAPNDSKVIKELNLSLDKYNLTAIDNNFELRESGIIYKSKFLLYYHPFLRNFFTSNFGDITRFLMDVSRCKGVKMSISIDPVRVSDLANYFDILEKDFWRGPKFSAEKLNSDRCLGLTVYKRIKNKELLDFSWPIDRTEFLTSNYKDSKKEIQIEEICPAEKIAGSQNFVLQKYAHMIWDEKQGNFEHIDVAVKIYEKPEHIKRLGYEWFPIGQNLEARVYKKIKLFRIDGSIDGELAKDIISSFFRMNELVGEFFSGI